jgi:hypothetical protein
MRLWFEKLSVLMLLLVLPLQGVAAVLMPLACVGAPTHHAASAAGSHPHPAAEQSHQHDAFATAGDDQGNENGGTSKNISGHHLCHLFSTVLTTPSTVAAADLPELISSISLPSALFVPEQPQRPPRV